MNLFKVIRIKKGAQNEQDGTQFQKHLLKLPSILKLFFSASNSWKFSLFQKSCIKKEWIYHRNSRKLFPIQMLYDRYMNIFMRYRISKDSIWTWESTEYFMMSQMEIKMNQRINQTGMVQMLHKINRLLFLTRFWTCEFKSKWERNSIGPCQGFMLNGTRRFCKTKNTKNTVKNK